MASDTVSNLPEPPHEEDSEAARRPNGHADFTIRTPDPEEGPDMSVLRLGRRPPPELPLQVFGDVWGNWIKEAAEAAAAPVDYVALPLLAAASSVIGHARWPMAWPGWEEPPHLWAGAVG